ncbi:concanavalin a-like lectin glucanase [Diplodia corticola]|uniref:Concanavalin a-like lectin glucanase n=1 Tax=Diplodia corticola TaxID=236234 RepID=A0A1J9RZV8_9PEZI|nr:concanavalin a-like lectin glucanase [Diplodia corticola]OJD32981.1 concanavalin a-like lectin glucanase [Diplodia corticola]
MHPSRGLLSAGMLACAGTALAQLTFETDATLHDYPSLKDGSAKYNPPWCEMGYDSLDLNSVTSYCSIDKTTCGACLNVCGSKGCKYLLAMDRCTRTDGQLDMSVGAGQEIGGATTGHLKVKVTQVDASYCQHIWNGQMFFSWQVPSGSLATLQSMIVNGATTASYLDPATRVPIITSHQSSPTLATTTSSTEAAPTTKDSALEETEAASMYSTPTSSQVTSEDLAPVETASLSAETSASYSVLSESAAISTDASSDTATDVVADSNDSGEPTTTENEASAPTTDGSLAGESEDYTTLTTTVPGSTIYYTITGCPPGATNCPKSLQSIGTSTLTNTVETTVVVSTYATLYPSGSTETGDSDDSLDTPDAKASSGLSAGDITERHEIVAPAKRSNAPGYTASKSLKAIMALIGLSAIVIMAL